jgi:hypothetical protein
MERFDFGRADFEKRIKFRNFENFQNIFVDAAKEKGDAFRFRLIIRGDQDAQRQTRHKLNVLEIDDNAFFFAVFDQRVHFVAPRLDAKFFVQFRVEAVGDRRVVLVTNQQMDFRVAHKLASLGAPSSRRAQKKVKLARRAGRRALI